MYPYLDGVARLVLESGQAFETVGKVLADGKAVTQIWVTAQTAPSPCIIPTPHGFPQTTTGMEDFQIKTRVKKQEKVEW
jgi:hypothetical protein